MLTRDNSLASLRAQASRDAVDRDRVNTFNSTQTSTGSSSANIDALAGAGSRSGSGSGLGGFDVSSLRVEVNSSVHLIEHRKYQSRLEHFIVCLFERLTLEEQKVLRTACVIGNNFSRLVLYGVLPRHLKSAMYTCLRSLTGKNWIMKCGSSESSEYVFRHPLMSKTIYDLSPASIRMRIHKSVAEFTEEMSPNQPQNFAFLKYHYSFCDPDKAFEYSVKTAALYYLQLDAFNSNNISPGTGQGPGSGKSRFEEPMHIDEFFYLVADALKYCNCETDVMVIVKVLECAAAAFFDGSEEANPLQRATPRSALTTNIGGEAGSGSACGGGDSASGIAAHVGGVESGRGGGSCSYNAVGSRKQGAAGYAPKSNTDEADDVFDFPYLPAAAGKVPFTPVPPPPAAGKVPFTPVPPPPAARNGSVGISKARNEAEVGRHDIFTADGTADTPAHSTTLWGRMLHFLCCIPSEFGGQIVPRAISSMTDDRAAFQDINRNFSSVSNVSTNIRVGRGGTGASGGGGGGGGRLPSTRNSVGSAGLSSQSSHQMPYTAKAVDYVASSFIRFDREIDALLVQFRLQEQQQQKEQKEQRQHRQKESSKPSKTEKLKPQPKGRSGSAGPPRRQSSSPPDQQQQKQQQEEVVGAWPPSVPAWQLAFLLP